jgi:hypothetical protein
MPPSKFTNPEAQRRAEKQRFEKKNKPKPVLAEKFIDRIISNKAEEIKHGK